MKKKIMSIVLAVAMLVPLFGFWRVDAQAYTPSLPTPQRTNTTALDIANIALSQVGYKEDNGTIYGKWWNDKGRLGAVYTYGAWCAMFACWTMDQAGLGFNTVYDQDSALAQSLYATCRSKCIYDASYTKDPQPGDLLFFSDSHSVYDIYHVAIVVGYNKETKTVTYVGGNEIPVGGNSKSPGVVRQRTISWSYGSKAFSFARPCSGSLTCSHHFTQWQSGNLDTICARFRTCTLCGYDEVKSTSLTHTFGDPRIEEGSCTAPGFTAVTCSGCGKVEISDYSGAEGHNVDWTVLEDATLTSTGEREGTCTACGELIREEIPMLELPFQDIDEGAWYEPAVRYTFANGIMNGVSQTEFAPDQTTNRAMLATVLWRLDGSPVSDATTHHFEDLTADWYQEAVNWAYESGIVTGRSDTVFAPEDPVTRQEAATMLHRYVEAKNGDVSAEADLSNFPDESEIDEYAQESFAWAVSSGLIAGVGQEDGSVRLAPASDTTRGQMATILMRLCKNV